MSNLDKKIENALKDATRSVGIMDEPSVVEDVIATFQGQYRGLLIAAGIKMAAAGVLMLFSIYQFFQQTSQMAMLAYASFALLCALTYCTIYLTFWISLNKHTTNREMKRLELQIALLIQKLESRETRASS